MRLLRDAFQVFDFALHKMEEGGPAWDVTFVIRAQNAVVAWNLGVCNEGYMEDGLRELKFGK